ncbi:hypothetical protein ASF96_04400 [Microbacterium sp. Leaf179]|nr:hypothetical protein ASF96_04400 [Microbacterium sp. Leaf179]
MSNITFFYPAAQKGYALGLNAAGGNLGASVAQFVVPIVITIGAAATLNLPLAGLIWVPLILVAMVGAYFRMDNLSAAKADVAASFAALNEPHLWILATPLHRHLRLVHRLHGPSRTRKIARSGRDVCP